MVTLLLLLLFKLSLSGAVPRRSALAIDAICCRVWLALRRRRIDEQVV